MDPQPIEHQVPDEPVMPAPAAQIKRFSFQAILGLIKQHRVISPLIAVILLLLLASGGWFIHARLVSQPQSKFAAVVIPFRVVGTTPEAGAASVINADTVTVKFSRAVDASKLAGDFFTSPVTKGTFSQGANDHEAVYKLDKAFDGGTSVQIMIHGEFKSLDGAQLGADYTFNFTTQTPDNSVIFSRNSMYDTLGSVRANDPQRYSIVAGSTVASGNTITIYQANLDLMLDSLLYDQTTSKFVHDGVNTAGLTQVFSKADVKNNDGFAFTPKQGIYVLTAVNKGTQVGHAWLVASNFGVITRQDDQQAVFAIQNFVDGSAASADVTTYHLDGSVQKLAEQTITDVGAIPQSYTPSLDLAVAKQGSDIAVVPLETRLSLADLRVHKDLSTSSVIYGLTDRPTYTVGEQIHYAGFIRTDNDAAYNVPTGGSVHLFVSDSSTGTHFADTDALIGQSGVIHGDFTIGAGAIPAEQTSSQLYVYNGSAINQDDTYTPVGAFTVTSNKTTSYRLQVNFAKSSYLASDQVSAVITGTKPDGSPLAGQPITGSLYAKAYSETDTESNLESFGETGDKIADYPNLALDANGRTTVTLDVSKFPAGTSQTATLQANFTDPAGSPVAGGDAAVIHEADAILTFAPSRTVLHSGSQLVSRLNATALGGKPLAGATISYTLAQNLDSGTKVLTTGSVTTDASGQASITQTLGTFHERTSLVLTAAIIDASNNKTSASSYYYVTDVADSGSFSDVQLSSLDISGAPKDITTGQTLNLTVDSPFAVHALVTAERGRIHSYKAVDLSAGKNTYSVAVGDDLAPSFSLVFSFFRNGTYQTEGVTYTVRPAKQATLALTVPATATAGQTIAATLKLTDASGSAASAPVVLAAVSANAYDLNSQVNPDIFDFFYHARSLTTNASSSLTGIGSGGGKCGGGWLNTSALLNPIGTTASWQPAITTSPAGTATVQLNLPKGTWRIYAYTLARSGDTGSAMTTVTVK